MATIVQLQPGYYPDPTAGRPVSNADIYVGDPDTDPEIVGNQKQISVQQENGDVTPVSQPMHTGAGGVPIYNGATVTILVAGDYSLKVLDSLGAQVYYIPESSKLEDGEVTLPKLAPGTPGSVIGYDEQGDAAEVIINPSAYVDWIDYGINAKVFGTDGLEYLANAANGPSSAPVDPVGDVTGTWVRAILQIQTIGASLGSNAMTVTLSPTELDFRDDTLGSGTVNKRKTIESLSIVVSSGSTLGTVSAVKSKIMVLAIDIGTGAIELAVVNISGGNNIDETTLISTTAEGGAGGADTANVIYSTTARTDVPFRVVGFVESTQATAGTWATAPSLVQGAGGQSLNNLSGRTWQAVTRVLGTAYYNETGREIRVVAELVNDAAAYPLIDVTQNGVTSRISGQYNNNTSVVQGIQGDVPAGASYVLNFNAGGGGSIVSSAYELK